MPETQTVHIKLHTNGIARFEAKESMTRTFEIEDLQAISVEIDKFQTTHRLFLIPIKNGKYSQEARQYLSTQKHVADKIAMVAKGPFQRITGNFFLGLNRPSIPIKLFSSESDATKWLLDQS